MNILNVTKSIRTTINLNLKGANTMKTINSTVMTTAWAIRKNAAQEMGCKVSDVLMSECLRMAWAMVKAGQSIKAEAETMGTESVYRWLKNACHKYAKTAIGKTSGSNDWEHGEYAYNQRLESPAFDWYGSAEYLLDDMAQEAFLALQRRLENPAKLAELASKGKTLKLIVWDSAQYGVTKIVSQESKHARCIGFEAVNNSGDTFSLLDVLADEKAINPADILSDAGLVSLLRDFAATLDEKNAYILQGKIRGLNEREMGKHLKISGPAVHKRVEKIRAALREFMAA